MSFSIITIDNERMFIIFSDDHSTWNYQSNIVDLSVSPDASLFTELVDIAEPIEEFDAGC